MNRGNPWNGYGEPTAGTELLDLPQFDQSIREKRHAEIPAVPEPALACTTLADRDGSARRCYYAAMAVIAVLICLPVWVVEYPPLVDYPNHIARCHIRQTGSDVAVFGERYIFDNTPIPALLERRCTMLASTANGVIYRVR